jgi:hypothetical protein
MRRLERVVALKPKSYWFSAAAATLMAPDIARVQGSLKRTITPGPGQLSGS